MSVEQIGLIVSLLAMLVGIYTIILGARERLRSAAERRELKGTIESSVGALNASLLDDVTRNIVDKLKENRSLAQRLTTVHVEAKRHFARVLARGRDSREEEEAPAGPRAVIELLVQHTVGSGGSTGEQRSLFLESGSTLAYLAKEVADSRLVASVGQGRLRVTTNNILVDQTLVFEPDISVHLFDGTPIGRYGATFGESTPVTEPEDLIRLWRRSGVRRPIGSSLCGHQESERYISSETQYAAMRRDIEQYFERYGRPRYLMMTTSNLSLVDGPHVGSFQNRDFKQCLYEYAVAGEIPILMALYDAKIQPDAMPAEQCLSVFGHDACRTTVLGEPSGENAGFHRFAWAIARGELALAVTNHMPPEEGIAGDRDTNAGRLFAALQRLQEIRQAGYGIIVRENSRRTLRLFTPDRDGLKNKGAPQSCIDFVQALEGYATSRVFSSIRAGGR